MLHDVDFDAKLDVDGDATLIYIDVDGEHLILH